MTTSKCVSSHAMSVLLENTSKEDKEEILEVLKNLKQFNEGPTKPAAKELFTNIRGVAHGEIQQSLFLTSCWPKANEILAAKAT